MTPLTSVIIPARNESYLQNTIDNVLDNAKGDIEVIAVEDGYTSNPPLTENPRLKVIHFDKSVGQRKAINEAAKVSQGKFIMKLDAHCAVDEGFDLKLSDECEYEWTVIPRMYNLDTATWKPRYRENFDHAVAMRKLHDYMYIGINEKKELRTLYYPHDLNSKLHHEKKDVLLDDTMSCMGPCFFMHKDRFFELGGCDENHEGGWGQQGVEVSLKAWLSGGALKVNKKTWFAHWFRAGDGGFPYPISGNQINRVREYSKDFWLNNKWEKAIRKFMWLVEKFDPPGWEHTETDKMDLFRIFYKHMIRDGNLARWRGVPALKFPADFMLYQEVIMKNKPDFIIETGTRFGGSSLFLADMCELAGNGQVITIDIRKGKLKPHPRITYLEGSSIDNEMILKISEMVGGKSCMVILDSNHRWTHVCRELLKYSRMVTKGQFLVVEDCYTGEGKTGDPANARDWFLKKDKSFKLVDKSMKFIVGLTMGGWLQKQ